MSPPSLLSRRRALRAGATALAAGVAGCLSSLPGRGATDQSGPAVRLDPVAEGLEAPLAFEVAPGREEFYVAEQTGRIRVVDPESGVRQEPFLDVRDRLVSARGERGLLGFAFHPDYAENGKVYVRYSAPRREGTPESFDHTFVLAEFRASEDRTRLRPDTERALLEIPEPQGNHNAGAVAFGPDGHLYVGTGDGGSGGDQGTGHVEDWYDAVGGGNGQDVTENLLGSILRIDPDGATDGRPYGIPEDNPLVGREGLDEHYAWGFRNPWRFSFAPDGRLVVADVGQYRWEEVSVVERGGNYGWNVREGTHCYDAESCPSDSPTGPLRDPVLEYPHSDAAVSGNAVIGGYVHRGSLPGLSGEYVFGDYTGGLFVATTEGEEWPTRPLTVTNGRDDGRPPGSLLAFGEDREGALYACLSTGTVARLAAPEGATATPGDTGGTATPDTATSTATPGDGGGSSDGETTPEGESSGSGSGFGALAALGGLAGLAALRGRGRD